MDRADGKVDRSCAAKPPVWGPESVKLWLTMERRRREKNRALLWIAAPYVVSIGVIGVGLMMRSGDSDAAGCVEAGATMLTLCFFSGPVWIRAFLGEWWRARKEMQALRRALWEHIGSDPLKSRPPQDLIARDGFKD